MSIYTIIFFLVIFFLPFLFAIIFSITLLKRSKRGRRSPLTTNLLRSPGESLRKAIDDFSDKIENYFYSLFLVPMPSLILLWFFSYLGEEKVAFWQISVCLVLYVLVTVWMTRRLYSALNQRRLLYLGLDAEVAVGQELNHLMSIGYRVFHDFPAENFNIDHVAVGPGGLFAIETKGRAKPDKGRGTYDAKVTFDGSILRFPGWEEKKPIEQAHRQAKWLAKWVSSAIGEEVGSKPVLALPGWFVERKAPSNVVIYNGKNPQSWARPQRENQLSDKMISRITHQLEQRCRDVAPVGYRKEKKG